MTSLEKLDAVLQTLIDYRTKEHITLERLFQLHNKTEVGFGNVTFVLNKLQKDGYVEVVKTKIPDTESYSAYYTVNFDGLVFNEQGGYVVQNMERARLATMVIRQSVLYERIYWLTVVIAIGTTIAALYYGTEILKNFYNQCQQ